MAWEIFYPAGPFALLPMRDAEDGSHRSALVWTVDEKDAAGTLKLGDRAFLAEVETRMHDILGRVTAAGPRSSFPLGFHHTATIPDQRLALIGDAAHGIHPIAGQGLNLGLRDVGALVEKARSTIPVEERGFVRMTGPLLHLAVVGGPTQTILRPSEIEDQSLVDGVVADLSSADGYFSYRRRTEPHLDHGALVIEQENGAALRIDEAGALLLSVPIEEATGHLKPLIEEHVGQAIEKGLTFADKMLEKFDRTQRLTRIVIAADIATSGVFGWRTSSQQAASPNSMQIAMDRSASGPVMLNPPDRTRMALRSERTRMAEDLLALLRRRYRS